MLFYYTVYIVSCFLGDQPKYYKMTDYNNYKHSKNNIKMFNRNLVLESDIFLSTSWGSCDKEHTSIKDIKELIDVLSKDK
jgi:hypothetical protein